MRSNINLGHLYEKYCDQYPFFLNQHSEPSDWTQAVKSFWIAEANSAPGIVVHTRVGSKQCANHEDHEYMMDVVWEDTTTNSLLLALEVEWSTKVEEQIKDFKKILYAKARYKVFLFQVNRRSGPPDSFVSHLSSLVAGSGILQQPPEEYLFICHRDGSVNHTLSGYLMGADGDYKPLPERTIHVP